MMALIYATVLGVGVANRIAVGTFYEVVIWGVLSRSPVLGAIVLSGFGVGRAMPFIWMIGQSETADECFCLVDRLDRLFPICESLEWSALAIAGSYFLSSFLGLVVGGGKYGR